MRVPPMLAFLVIVVHILACGQAFAQRPAAPEGYTWQEIEEVKAAVLKPEGWHYSKTITKDAVAFRVSKEKVATNRDVFLTGLTVNVVKDVKAKTNVKPSLYAAHHVKNYMKNTTGATEPRVDRIGALQRITCFVNKKLPNVDKIRVFRIRVSTYANDATGTLFIVTFGAPKDEWDTAYQTGKQLFSPLVLSLAI